jgi:hypothetical protein
MMKKLLLSSTFVLLLLSQAQAQTAPPPAPPAAPESAAAPTGGCEGADKAQVRSCYQQRAKDARRALDQKIADVCKKQGARGPSLWGCRADMLMKAADAIN